MVERRVPDDQSERKRETKTDTHRQRDSYILLDIDIRRDRQKHANRRTKQLCLNGRRDNAQLREIRKH